MIAAVEESTRELKVARDIDFQRGADQGPRGRRDEDLAAVSGAGHAGGTVDIVPAIQPVFIRPSFTAMETHANPH